VLLLLFFQGGIRVSAVVAADATAGFYVPGSAMAESLQEDTPAPPARRGFSLFVTEGADSKRLWSQTRLVFVSGLVAAGIIYTMPSDVTGWDKDIKASELADKWWDNVSRRPEWDKDDWVINYVGHAYFGGVYYQVARKSGYNQWDSFVYTTLMSTFFWEYGLEAFAERPSIQDLIYTPISGWLCGEWAYGAEKRILAQGGKVMGSEMLGSLSLFFLDPVDHIGDWVNRLSGRDLVITGAVSLEVSQLSPGSRSMFGLGVAGRF
jgi:hypothetical protein